MTWKFWRHGWDELPEDLPVDVYPCSNGEFLPPDPTAEQYRIMALQNVEVELVRRKMGMSRRDFVRTSGAYLIGLWAINQVTGGKWGSYALAHNTETNRACDLEWPGAQMNNLPGEFIFDVQSHHVESDGTWRVTNPGFELFFAAIWSQAGGVGGGFEHVTARGGGEIDPIENLSRYHYLKELYLDSSTNMTVLSAVPSSPDDQPLPIEKARLTIDTVKALAGGTQRCVMHAFVMPNRGSLGTTSDNLGVDPVYMKEEFDYMRHNASEQGENLRGWKTYTAWGDIPYASGWFLDDHVGLQFLDQVVKVGNDFGMPKLVAVHKGFALPAFDQRAASPRDIGPAARQYPEVKFLVYHSGFDMETQNPYPGDDQVNSADRSVNSLIKSLRENGIDASRHIPSGLSHGNSPNVYAEIGSTWRSVMGNANQAAHLLGKLITYVGPRRICWGTDSLWFGSPQSEIVAMRNFQFSSAAQALYNLPYGLDGDSYDPTRNALSGTSYMSPHPNNVPGWPTDGVAHPERTIRNAIFGRNAAEAYGIDPDVTRNAIDCDEVQKIRDSYIINQGTPREAVPLSMNQLHGFRTRRDVLKHLVSKPWSP